MSYILEALRKSERERQLAQAPSLPSVITDPSPSRRRWLPWLLVWLLGIGCAVLFRLWLHESEKPLPQVDTTRAIAPHHPAQAPAAATPPPSVQTGLSEPTPGKTDRAPEPPPLEVAEQTEADSPAAYPMPSSRPPLAEETPKQPARVQPPASPIVKTKPPLGTTGGNRETGKEPSGEKPPRPDENRLKRASPGSPEREPSRRQQPDNGNAEAVQQETPLPGEVPVALQREMPELKINVLAYSSVPDERFAIINMTKYSKGDRLPGGAVLAEIQADGVVLEMKGARFKLSHR